MLNPTDKLNVISVLAKAIVDAMTGRLVTDSTPVHEIAIGDLVENHMAPRPQFCGHVLREHKRSIVAAILDELWIQRSDPRFFNAEPADWEGCLEYTGPDNGKAAHITLHAWPLGIIHRPTRAEGREGGAA